MLTQCIFMLGFRRFCGAVSIKIPPEKEQKKG